MSYTDIIDTRTLAEELDELEGLEEDDLSEDDRERMKALNELADEVGSEFYHGETMIPESSFKDYAQQLAEDIGAISRDVSWPLTCIDWEQAADELLHDYSSVEWENETFYVRTS
jgi:antirestriction protein